MKSSMHFGKIGIRNGYVFETSKARPHPISGQVPPSHGGGVTLSHTSILFMRLKPSVD